MNFENKVALITGAAGTIGRTTAKLFIERGGKAALVDNNKNELGKIPVDLNLKETDYLLITADVSREDDVIRYVEETIKKFGHIDLFFNNAGIEGQNALFTDYSSEIMEKVCDINIKGVFWGLKHVLKAMIKAGKGGAIVNASSCAGIKGMPGTVAYVASKHAVIGMTRTAALENGKYGIRVNAVCPAIIDGPMMDRLRSSQLQAQGKEATGENLALMRGETAKRLPIGRTGRAEDVAEGVLYLGSDAASFVTGVALPIDGGITL